MPGLNQMPGGRDPASLLIDGPGDEVRNIDKFDPKELESAAPILQYFLKTIYIMKTDMMPKGPQAYKHMKMAEPFSY